jgi:flavorubredoxin
MQEKQDICYCWSEDSEMGRLTPSFRQLYEETISELKTELQAALVDLGHKSAFDLLLKEAWNSEQAAMGNSTLPTVCDKLNIMASIHNRKLLAALLRQLNERDSIIEKLEERTVSLEDQINQLSLEIKGKTGQEEEDKKNESAT